MSNEARPFVIDPVIDVEKFVKANNCPRVTNPILFSSEGAPTVDGLLSYELFGTSTRDRSNIFGYIDLNGVFIHPLIYKVWNSMDSTISKIVWSDNKYKVNSSGKIVEDENGESGIEFLEKNFDKIKIPSTDKSRRNTKIKFLKKNKDKMFIRKFIIVPPYVRDVLTTSGKTEVGELNQMYQKILIGANSIESMADYGITIDYLTRGKMQEEIVKIYTWLTKEPNLGQKHGIIRRSVLSKTIDYSSRLVMTAPDLNVESPQDILTSMDYATVPLASIIANIKPFMLFWLRNRFNNMFSGTGTLYTYTNADETFERVGVENFEAQFNDERYDKEISKFISGFSSRFDPVTITLDDGTIEHFYAEINGEVRQITWCEVFYVAACELVTDKHVLLTRYPIDSYLSEFPCKIKVITTTDALDIEIKGRRFENYPNITKDLIGTDTSNRFRDTVNIFNPYLGAIGGDYDGDQLYLKVAFSDEANAELEKFTNSKMNYIDAGIGSLRNSSNEAIQTMYNLTLILDKDKPLMTKSKDII